MKSYTISIKESFFIRNTILIIVLLCNCNVIFSQISFQSVESYFVDLTKTKITKHIYSISTSSPDIFVFFYKIQISNNSKNDYYIQSENSKFILGEDTIKILIYTKDQEFLDQKYLIPKGKSYIYLYCHYNKNDIPMNISLLDFDNLFNFFELKNELFKNTQVFLANNSPIPIKIKNKNFKIILSEKSKTLFFKKYSLYKFETDYINYINGINNKIDNTETMEDF